MEMNRYWIWDNFPAQRLHTTHFSSFLFLYLYLKMFLHFYSLDDFHKNSKDSNYYHKEKRTARVQKKHNVINILEVKLTTQIANIQLMQNRKRLPEDI